MVSIEENTAEIGVSGTNPDLNPASEQGIDLSSEVLPQPVVQDSGKPIFTSYEENSAASEPAPVPIMTDQSKLGLDGAQIRQVSEQDLAGADKVTIRSGKNINREPGDPRNQAQDVSVEPLEAIAALKESFRRISKEIVGREELLNQTLYALLTREHQLIFSRAGTAKSLYASTVFGQFDGARTFSIQMTKGTSEEGLVGGVNIEELKKGNIIHNTTGSIVEARLAFLDEIFDSNDVALRSLLGILNERLFRKGKQTVEAELHCAIATTNYLRSSDVTEAVIDRFLFRAKLLPDGDPYNMLRIDQAYQRNGGRVVDPGERKLIPIDWVDRLADIVEGRVPEQQISVPAHVLFLKNEIISEFMTLANKEKKASEAEVYVSPRTIAKARDVLNASALIHGRMEVTSQDLDSLRYMVTIVGDEKHEKAFAQALKNVNDSFSKGDINAVDALMEAHELLEVIINKVDTGKGITPSFMERIKIFFGLTTLSELTFSRIGKAVENLEVSNPRVQPLRESLLERIAYERKRYESPESRALL